MVGKKIVPFALVACALVALGGCAKQQHASVDDAVKAIQNKDMDALKSAIAGGVSPNDIAKPGMPLVELACQFSFENGAVYLVDEGACSQGLPVAATSFGCDKVIDEMIAKKMPINTYGRGGTTALHEAVRRDDPDLIKKLIPFFGQIDIADSSGYTPLALACSRLSLKAAKVLVQYHADPKLTTLLGHDSITWAKNQKSKELLDILGVK